MSTVARRYTAGLFGYAQEHGVLNVVDEGLKVVAQAVAENVQFKNLLEHPLISADRKAVMVDDVFGQAVDPVVTRFLKLLIENGRADQLQAVYTSFHTLAEDARGVVEVTVESALPLNAEQVAEIEKQLSSVFNKKAQAVVQVKPELIAGYRVQVGNRVLDATVKAALRQFSGQLLHRGATRG